MTFRKEDFTRAGLLLLAMMVFAYPAFAAEQEDVNLQGKRIAAIKIEGNVTLTRAQVLAKVRARAGETFDRSTAAEDARRIAEVDGVEYSYYNASPQDGQVLLTYVVVEKNLVRALEFPGSDKISENRLSAELAFKQGDYLDLFLVNNGRQAIEDLYHKRGYVFTEITVDREKLEVGQVFYKIEEGPRVKVKEVNFVGNEALTDKELDKGIKTRTRALMLWPVYYKEDVAEEDVAKLTAAYQDRGYLDVQVTKSVEFSENRKKAYVTFTIDEGPKYTVGEVSITGNEYFTDAELQTENLKLMPGQSYSEERSDFDARKIQYHYREIGFINATVDQKRSFGDGGTVDVEFQVTEGDRFRIGKVNISGNEAVKGKVIRRILDEEEFTPGKWYDADAARGNGQGQLENTVKRLALTESTFIQPTGDAADHRDANVNVVESRTGSIMFGAGVASNTGLIGQVTLDQRNFDLFDYPDSFSEFITGQAFKGAGQRFKASFLPGTEESSFSVTFTEPYLYDKPLALDFAASGFTRVQEAYDENRLKGYIGLEKRYADDWRRGIAFRVENISVDDLEPDAPVEIRDVKGDNGLLGVKAFIRKDTTDNRFLPTSGYHFDAGYEQVGGDHNFGIVSATQRWYKTLHEDLAERKTVLETKIKAGAIVGDAPPFERFYAGGTGSLRGFEYRGVSPRGLQTNVANPEYEDPIGSDWLLIGSAEVAVPLTSDVFSWLFFVDTGAVETGGVRASVGTGLQILLPQWFGPVPMRFELAAPLAKDETDDTQAFSFSVGALF
ncbi:Outer membrane protein Omp85 [Anaerohalosphaera lusitana]|uniref:Outer membrane protein assembly factor BamA n=1 Tax=Anaerohalosphaera lusitana TaxID=1936003 RepID=A0A1U9NHD3_9BACT|nr:outer membrane protein assembly factor BamA [Anaerohalosphaera lusitana]AQT67333.1 Outer membrane protein Omp85 [Anaerohalosphaera lusitana]